MKPAYNSSPPVGTSAFLPDSEKLFTVLNSVAGTSVKIMPAIEGVGMTGCTAQPAISLPDHPEAWLYKRVERLVKEFLRNTSHPEWRATWLQMYDRNGALRFAINLLHVASKWTWDNATSAQSLSAALDLVASEISLAYDGELIGFTLDPWNAYCEGQLFYTPDARDADSLSSASILGIQAFNPELTIGGRDPQSVTTLNACPNPFDSNRPTCTNNNDAYGVPTSIDSGGSAQSWKRDWVNGWVNSGIPMILDVSPGYDGHVLFGPGGFAGLYGDNTEDGIVDPWRNYESAMKRRSQWNGRSPVGIVYNAWNGFAEGLAAAPFQYNRNGAVLSPSGFTAPKDWLTSQFSVDPRYCDHRPFSGGLARGAHTFGSICDLWQCLGAVDGYGEPVSAELNSTGGRALITSFENGGKIYFNPSSGATHEVHGAIQALYYSGFAEDAGGSLGNIGLPVSDEEPLMDNTNPLVSVDIGRISYFEQGYIYWLRSWGPGSSAQAVLAPSAGAPWTSEHGGACVGHTGADVAFMYGSPP